MTEPAGSREIELHLIQESPTNPRTHFDEAKLAELSESILRHGVLQPILVRPRPGGGGYELVAGHRRYRACRLVAREKIPAIVQKLTDQEVLEIQLVENLQREGLHPLEEADGYAALIKLHGYDADQVAEKIRRSRSYVYGRMKLAALCASAKKALWDGALSHSVALLIARIPDEKLQGAATKELLKYSAEGALSFRRAADIIDREFLKPLKDARWALDDVALLPAAGACTTCPFRSANQDFVGGSGGADVCTKPACFVAKGDALWERRKANALARGESVLPATAVSKVFDTGQWGGHGVRQDADVVSIDARASDLGHYEKTYRQLLPKGFVPPVTVARHPRTGEVFELIAKQELAASLKAAGVTKVRASSRDDYAAKQRQEMEKRKLDRAIEEAITVAVIPHLEKLPLNAETLRTLTVAIAVERFGKLESWLKRRGVSGVAWDKREKTIAGIVAKLTVGQMLALLAESVLTFSPTEMRLATDVSTQHRLCELAGVDWRAIEKGLRDAAAEKKRAKSAKEQQKAAKNLAAAKVSKKAAALAAKAKAKGPKGEAVEGVDGELQIVRQRIVEAVAGKRKVDKVARAKVVARDGSKRKGKKTVPAKRKAS